MVEKQKRLVIGDEGEECCIRFHNNKAEPVAEIWLNSRDQAETLLRAILNSADDPDCYVEISICGTNGIQKLLDSLQTVNERNVSQVG